MCGTCGCGSPDGHISIQKPGAVLHDHQHHHDHSHGEHTHEHSHHDHGHSHTHDHAHGHTHGHTHDPVKKTVIEVQQNILQHNDLMAARNRGYFEAKNLFVMNLVSSPGSGKTMMANAIR